MPKIFLVTFLLSVTNIAFSNSFFKNSLDLLIKENQLNFDNFIDLGEYSMVPDDICATHLSNTNKICSNNYIDKSLKDIDILKVGVKTFDISTFQLFSHGRSGELLIEGGSNTGLTFNSCNNSVTIDALDASGSFTISKGAATGNQQCGAFSVTINIEVGYICPDTVTISAPNTIVCSTQSDKIIVDPLPTLPTGYSYRYQWEQSTDCTGTFTEIECQTDSILTEPTVGTFAYRLVVDVVPQTIHLFEDITGDSTYVEISITPASCPGGNDGSIEVSFLEDPDGYNYQGGFDFDYGTGNQWSGTSSVPYTYTVSGVPDVDDIYFKFVRWTDGWAAQKEQVVNITNLGTYGSECSIVSNCTMLTLQESSSADTETLSGTCVDGSPDVLASALINNIVNADKIGISSLNEVTYDGPDYDAATVLSGTSHTFADLEYNSLYTIRLFDTANDCFIEFLVSTPNDPCSVLTSLCECDEYLYLNEQVSSTEGAVHKFVVNADSTLTEVGSPWFGPTTLTPYPHGLAQDNNGFTYIASDYSPGEISRLSCNGELLDYEDVFDTSLGTETYNFFAKDRYMYVYDRWENQMEIWDLCTRQQLGAYCIDLSTTDQPAAWGLYLDDTSWYLTFQEGVSADFGVWSGPLDPLQFTEPCTNTVSSYLFSLPARAMGITRDGAGNYYVIVDQNVLGTTTTAKIMKYSSTGTLISETATVGSSNGNNTSSGLQGDYGMRGIVYSETTNLLYVSNFENCITVYDTDLTEQVALNIGNPANTVPKGISIATECCPTVSSYTAEKVVCGDNIVGTTLLIEDLLPCDGIICEGVWEADSGNSGITYDDCDQSLTIDLADACGTFTLTNDGSGLNLQCSPFVFTINISTGDAVASSILGAVPSICAGEEAETININNLSSLASTIEFQWEMSTESDSTGFTSIDGATASSYNPGVLTDTTYFRVINMDASCSDEMCRDTSNAIAVLIDDEVCSSFDVALVKTINTATPGPYAAGGTVSFDVTVVNQGTATTYDIDVADYVPTGLTYSSLTAAAMTVQSNTLNVVGTGPNFEIEELMSGDSAVVTLNFTIDAGTTGNLINNAEIIDAADTDGGTTATDEDSPLGTINDGTTNELATNDNIDDDFTSGTDLATDEDDYDAEQICIPPTTTAAATDPTCTGTLANSDGTITLSSFTTGEKYDYTMGAIYSGSATFDSGSTSIPASGEIVNTLANPTGSQDYTVRIFNSNDCYVDRTVTLNETDCSCTDPILTDLMDEAICFGGSFTASNVTTSVTNGVPVSYQWYDNNGTNNTGTAAINGETSAALATLPTVVGTYSYLVEATSTDEASCSATTIVNLTINPTPTITSIDTAFCGTQTINLSSLISGTTSGTVSYGTTFGNYPFAITTDVTVSSTTTFYIRDSIESTMCVDTAIIVVTLLNCDWGDLPDTSATTNMDNYQTTSANNGPVHVIDPNLQLGATIDGEVDGQPSTSADGDGLDEDGIEIFQSLDIAPGTTFRLPLTVINNTGNTAHLEAWIDWNGDGDFMDTGEMVTDLDDSGGFPTYLEITTPTDAKTGSLLGFRVRLSNTNDMTPYGFISNGEIEDYLLGIDCPQVICLPISIKVLDNQKEN